jgi:hypothetical protein
MQPGRPTGTVRPANSKWDEAQLVAQGLDVAARPGHSPRCLVPIDAHRTSRLSHVCRSVLLRPYEASTRRQNPFASLLHTIELSPHHSTEPRLKCRCCCSHPAPWSTPVLGVGCQAKTAHWLGQARAYGRFQPICTVLLPRFEWIS